MPIRNEFFGVFKTVKIGGEFMLAESVNRSRTMQVDAKAYIQGSAFNRILDIGAVSETISITAPVLIGGGAKVDGRRLVNDQLDNVRQRDSSNMTLPILSKASLKVDAQSGATYNIELKSDGTNIAGQFEVLDYSAEHIGIGTFTDVLNPEGALGPTRVARHYDFRLVLGDYYLYIMSANIDVDVDLQETHFIAGAVDPSNPLPSDPPIGWAEYQAGTNPFNFGTQFPWLGVAGVKVTGGGTAAALLANFNRGSGDYDFEDYGNDPVTGFDSWEAVNVALGSNLSDELTLQTPGCVAYSDKPFIIEVYDCDAAEWRNLFTDELGNEIITFKRAVINSANFKVSAGLLTVDFSFFAWTKE